MAPWGEGWASLREEPLVPHALDARVRAARRRVCGGRPGRRELGALTVDLLRPLERYLPRAQAEARRMGEDGVRWGEDGVRRG